MHGERGFGCRPPPRAREAAGYGRPAPTHFGEGCMNVERRSLEGFLLREPAHCVLHIVSIARVTPPG
jgi:hypothetical protein